MVKNIYLIRHGQSTFNALYDLNAKDPLHFDAGLSDTGFQQAREASKAAIGLGVELIVTSPLRRALETTLTLFGGLPVPILVSSLHREKLANSCDVGTPTPALAKTFPGLDFSHLDDIWWHDGEKDTRGVSIEPESVYQARITEFSQWISTRSENSIAVVGHRTFFHHLAGHRLENCEIRKWPQL
ncbi:MAG: histidine phosphatase family protein [Rhodospirillales bacterium]|jgi:glucosyl-3-phosphoglycerate phosphatase|nr:histidine phosphatase family protein [Rhodospirillales bacterium]